MQRFDTEEYNGFTNYDTWLANLWLFGNDERVYNCARMIVNKPNWIAVPRLESITEDMSKSGFIGDEIDFRNVNWIEIVIANREAEQYRRGASLTSNSERGSS